MVVVDQVRSYANKVQKKVSIKGPRNPIKGGFANHFGVSQTPRAIQLTGAHRTRTVPGDLSKNSK